MSDDTNHEYYRRRAATERSRAESTRDQTARRVHLELAERYAALITQPSTAG